MIAIIITIMVLEMKVPHGETLAALSPLVPILSSYILSFVYVGIYWNNHHHMLHASTKISGRVLWANLHLLFWLSLFPFATGWMGENHFTASPSALYGCVLLAAAIAYRILQQTLIAAQGDGAALKRCQRRATFPQATEYAKTIFPNGKSRRIRMRRPRPQVRNSLLGDFVTE